MLRTGTVLAIALVGGCAFDSFERGRTETLGAATEGEMAATRPGASGTQGVADGDGGAEGEGGSSPPPSTSGPSLPPDSDDDGNRRDFGSPPGTSGSDDGTIDCDTTVTFELSIEDASLLVEPMVAEQIGGIGLVAYSAVYDAGDVEFTVEIICPGNYYLHGYVADLWPGVHSNDDPDSYQVSWTPKGTATWYYGCQTSYDWDTWNWHPVTSGIQGQSCEEAMIPTVALPEGTQTIRFHNREPMSDDYAVAAIARVVLTNDPNYDPS